MRSAHDRVQNQRHCRANESELLHGVISIQYLEVVVDIGDVVRKW